MTDEVAHDLAAIDAALAGDPAPSELGALALLVRDERPRPEPGFAAALDGRAAAGFPRERGRRRARAPRLALRPALAIATSLLLAVAVAVSVLPGAQQDGGALEGALPQREAVEPAATPQATTPAERPAPADTAAPEGDTAAASPAPGASAPAAPGPSSAPAPARSVERSAELRLATSAERLDEVAAGVVRTVDGLGGYVVNSSVSAAGEDGSASFELRVPAARLSSAMARLSALGEVRSRSEASLDVTGRVVAARERIDALRAERAGALRQLAAAATPAQSARARARLRAVDARLARAQATRAELRRRTAYSTISVEVATERAGAGAGGGGSWTPRDALGDAVRVLELIAGGLLVTLAVLLPAALLAALGWGTWRAGATRRRERAIDAAA
jgi:hypothetical protein